MSSSPPVYVSEALNMILLLRSVRAAIDSFLFAIDGGNPSPPTIAKTTSAVGLATAAIKGDHGNYTPKGSRPERSGANHWTQTPKGRKKLAQMKRANAKAREALKKAGNT